MPHNHVLSTGNKMSEILTEISVKFRFSVEIDKISPPKFRFFDFSRYFHFFFPIFSFCSLTPKISKKYF